jgi:UDP-N-acetylmuramate: L-alanyl-gamma-D-glutamyl-meso-diaminopimelate ligase
MKPEKNPHIHFIAIGGSAMHNLAIALFKKGFHVTGSDDDIFEPSASRLKSFGLLPEKTGWYPEKVRPGTDAVILGMHARADNPELIAAQKLGIRIYSFPEYIYESKKEAKRIVIAGSHGKTTITSMIAYALLRLNPDFDYLVGAGIPGFENMVKLSDAPLMILEGDEYLSSTLDRTPKFIRYNHKIGLISGIAWDHINAFPTRELYISQFEKFIANTPDDGEIIYNEEDGTLLQLIKKSNRKIKTIPYSTPIYKVENEKYHYRYNSKYIALNIFGRHNMQNLAGAITVLERLGFTKYRILQILKSFPGASNRLEKVYDKKGIIIYKDFAHSPSKLRSTTEAIKEMYPDRKIINCFELHTYSSLNRNYISEYENSLSTGNMNIIFVNDHTLKIKKLEYLDENSIRTGFSNKDILICRKPEELIQVLTAQIKENTVLLMMSSGNFGGSTLDQLIAYLENKKQKCTST